MMKECEDALILQICSTKRVRYVEVRGMSKVNLGVVQTVT